MTNYMQIIMFCLIVTALVIAIIALVRANNEKFEGDSTTCCLSTSCDSDEGKKGWCIGTDHSGNLNFNYKGTLIKTILSSNECISSSGTCSSLPPKCQGSPPGGCCQKAGIDLAGCNACYDKYCQSSSIQENFTANGICDVGLCNNQTIKSCPCCNEFTSNCGECMKAYPTLCPGTPAPGPGPAPAPKQLENKQELFILFQDDEDDDAWYYISNSAPHDNPCRGYVTGNPSVTVHKETTDPIRPNKDIDCEILVSTTTTDNFLKFHGANPTGGSHPVPLLTGNPSGDGTLTWCNQGSSDCDGDNWVTSFVVFNNNNGDPILPYYGQPYKGMKVKGLWPASYPYIKVSNGKIKMVSNIHDASDVKFIQI